MNWKDKLYEQITLKDIYTWLEESDIYQSLSAIGDEIYPATQYGNAFVIESDPLAVAQMTVIQLGYYLGVASFMQLEHGLHLDRGSNLEYCTVITLRSMVELTARVHKAVRVFNEKPAEEFVEQSKRLTMPFVKGGGGGYNVLTLVESLKDRIPDIMDHYDEMSQYLHGDLMMHAMYRKLTFMLGHVHIPDDASEEEAIKAASTARRSPIIAKYDGLLNALRKVLLDDLKIVRQLAAPYTKRYLKHINEEK